MVEQWKKDMEEEARKKLGIKLPKKERKVQEEKLNKNSICDFVVLDLFTPEECEKIKEYCDKYLTLKPATIGKSSVDPVIRDSKTGWFPRNDETLWWVQDRIKDAILTINERKYRFDITHSEQVQFTQYGCGEHYTWHHDLSEEPPSNLRKLSVTIELSDGLHFDGGNLMLLLLGNRYHTVKRKQGQAVIFPSFVPHIVTEVKPKPGSG